MSQHTPEFTRYIGYDERTNERLFAVKSGPDLLLLPRSHARLIAKAPELYAVVKRAVCDAHHIQDGKQPCSVPRGRCSELCKRARALLREIGGSGAVHH